MARDFGIRSTRDLRDEIIDLAYARGGDRNLRVIWNGVDSRGLGDRFGPVSTLTPLPCTLLSTKGFPL